MPLCPCSNTWTRWAEGRNDRERLLEPRLAPGADLLSALRPFPRLELRSQDGGVFLRPPAEILLNFPEVLLGIDTDRVFGSFGHGNGDAVFEEPQLLELLGQLEL